MQKKCLFVYMNTIRVYEYKIPVKTQSFII